MSDMKTEDVALFISFIQSHEIKLTINTLRKSNLSEAHSLMKDQVDEILAIEDLDDRSLKFMTLTDLMISSIVEVPSLFMEPQITDSLMSYFEPVLFPVQWTGYFLDRLIKSLQISLQASKGKEQFCRFAFNFLPAFFNSSMKQQKIWISSTTGNNKLVKPELISTSVLRTHVLNFLASDLALSPSWASEVIEAIKLLEINSSELNVICTKFKDKLILSPDVPITYYPGLPISFLSLIKHSAMPNSHQIISVILTSMDMLESRVMEQQTQIASSTKSNNYQLREIYSLMLLAFEQNFLLKPKFISEFITVAQPFASKSTFTIALLLGLLRSFKTNVYKSDIKSITKVSEILASWFINSVKGVSNLIQQNNKKESALAPNLSVPASLRPAIAGIESSETNTSGEKYVRYETVLEHLYYGMEHVALGFIYLIFYLIEDTSKTIFETSTSKYMEYDLPVFYEEYISNALVEAIWKISNSIFQNIPETRFIILEELFSSISTGSSNIHTNIILIHKIIADKPHLLFPFKPKISEFLYQLSYLPSDSVKTLIRALSPLFVIDNSLYDTLMIVLRKGSFASDLNARSGSISGFLELLMLTWSSKIQFSDYQFEEITHEVFSFMRRALSQQASIRATLYTDIAQVFAKALYSSQTLSSSHMKTNIDSILSAIIDLLSKQLILYFLDPQDDENNLFTSPIKLSLENSIKGRILDGPDDDESNQKHHKKTGNSTIEIVEPMQITLQCCNAIILAEATASKGCYNLRTSVTSPIYAFMMRIIQYLIKSDLEDFELDESSTFSFESQQGLANYEAALMLIGIFEASLEFLMNVVPSTIPNPEQRARYLNEPLDLDSIEPPQEENFWISPSNDPEYQTQLKSKRQDVILQQRKTDLNINSDEENGKRNQQIVHIFAKLNLLKTNLKNRSTKSNTNRNTKAENEIENNDPTTSNKNGGEKIKASTISLYSKMFSPNLRPSLLSQKCIIFLMNELRTSENQNSLGNYLTSESTEIFSRILALITPKNNSKASHPHSQHQQNGGVFIKRGQSESSEYFPPYHMLTLETLYSSSIYFSQNMNFLIFYEHICSGLFYEFYYEQPNSVLALEAYLHGLRSSMQEESDPNTKLKFVSSIALKSIKWLKPEDETFVIQIKNSLDHDRILFFTCLILKLLYSHWISEAVTKQKFTEQLVDVVQVLTSELKNEAQQSLIIWIQSLIGSKRSIPQINFGTRSQYLKYFPPMLGLQQQQQPLPMNSTNTAMKILNLYWSLLSESPESHLLKHYLEIANDVLLVFGPNCVHNEIDLDLDLHYPIVASKQASPILNHLFESIDHRISVFEKIHTQITDADKCGLIPEDDVVNDASSTNDQGNLTPYLKRKTILYKETYFILQILHILGRSRLPLNACKLLATTSEKLLKLLNSWVTEQLKRKTFEPLIPEFRRMIDLLGQCFSVYNSFIAYWLQGALPIVEDSHFDYLERIRKSNDGHTPKYEPSEQKKKKHAQSSLLNASKQIPGLVYWMEKLHSESLMKLSKRADDEELLSSFTSLGHHDWQLVENITQIQNNVHNHSAIDVSPTKRVKRERSLQDEEDDSGAEPPPKKRIKLS